jgi:cyclin C
MQNVNLYLLAATAFYLASKTEEAPHHIRLVASEARQFWSDFVPGDVSRLGEMEFCLISDMRSQLIVWHPYRTLTELKDHQDLKLTPEEYALAWCVVNDSYMTDLPLTCSPHLIAVIAVFLAILFYPTTKNPIRQLSLDSRLSIEPNAFPSVGGRNGMAGMLGSISRLPMVAPHVSASSNGLASVPTRSATTDQPKPLPSDGSNPAVQGQNTDKVNMVRFQTVVKFLIESDIDLKQMVQGTQEIISLYEVWETYEEKTIKDAVFRCLKENSLNN